VVRKYPLVARVLKPIDFNEPQVLHPVNGEAAARIVEAGKTEKQIAADLRSLNKVQRMFYRNAGDF
jgi:hypothetical protein